MTGKPRQLFDAVGSRLMLVDALADPDTVEKVLLWLGLCIDVDRRLACGGHVQALIIDSEPVAQAVGGIRRQCGGPDADCLETLVGLADSLTLGAEL
eukprot:gnl/TRDRNA2_/TRDRNA2_175868_c3_seq1.p2 gnl/TRDRNA2_/TRDRNA2_175868_c3~~gnl/TRDRNA2_/TRDRNA2_175868_c3_seq1.p2  ORF type:complete len:113 (+),score=19.50 gnl/TRDRNA2_/TRDRNA2_175868_c3_seq1:50-340(+)